MWHAWERGEEYVQDFDGESQKERYHLEDQGVEEGMGSEWIIRRLAGDVLSGSDATDLVSYY
jgi:hypothetical protein